MIPGLNLNYNQDSSSGYNNGLYYRPEMINTIDNLRVDDKKQYTHIKPPSNLTMKTKSDIINKNSVKKNKDEIGYINSDDHNQPNTGLEIKHKDNNGSYTSKQ